MEPIPLLTKSDFVAGRSCVRRMWLGRFRPELKTPLSAATRDRMRTGQAVQELARRRYPEGRMAWEPALSIDQAAAETRRLMEDGASCIFEATVVADGCMARIDVLSRGEGGGWSVEEIKSSTVKPLDKLGKQITDVSFQAHVAQKAGLNVEQAKLLLIDSSYRWHSGDYDPFGALKSVDVTAEWLDSRDEIAQAISHLRPHLSSAEEPQVETNTHCKDCDFHAYCHREQPEHDLVFLPRIKANQVEALRRQGYGTIDLLPHEIKMPKGVHRLSIEALRARNVVISGQPFVGDGLAEALARIEMPATFIDFESCQDGLPRYTGVPPYTQVCFQWSAHLIEDPEREARHLEFLHRELSDPREEFCRSLWEAVRDCRTIVHYASFEKTEVTKMAADGVPYADRLQQLLAERGLDLEQLVKEHVYFAGFKGRTGIKSVLPVLVPGLSYEGLSVGDGQAATAAFRELQAPGLPEKRRAELIEGLLRYCELDTLAMVEIYRALRRLTGS
jgi:predicted RecB family nuclease